MHSLKYQRSTTLGCKDVRIKKSEFAAKTQFPFDNLLLISINGKANLKISVSISCISTLLGHRKIIFEVFVMTCNNLLGHFKTAMHA